ncbi:MAG: protein of unknown function DUF115 [Idiomarinaceae bacterium HL-53]|nr:MAG: protein of unknown function DUF115 [Idiomarinaceae bacterium HL-53]CUS47192.1 Protein of unknown function DUF115 [Idiomarinaceae bacterium HL-53]
MLKSIRHHLHTDKNEQVRQEKTLDPFLNKRFEDNKAAFQVVMPHLAVAFQESVIDEYGLFCNKEGELNLTGRANSQVVYGLHPEQECQQDIERFQQNAPVVKFSGPQVPPKPLLRSYQMPESQGFVPAIPMEPLPEKPDTVIMFGLGLGYALETLIAVSEPQNIIVYEPTLDFFRGSIRVANWKRILLDAESKGIRLFLQLGQDGLNIGEDLKQLQEMLGAKSAYLYKHYHHPVMDVVYDYLLGPDFDFQKLITGQVQLPSLDHVTHYLPFRAGRVSSSISREDAREKIAAMQALKAKNLMAFAEQFPEIYQQFNNYQPQFWRGFIDDSGSLNVYHEFRQGALYHANPEVLANEALAEFGEEPNRNDMFAGYSGGKLWRYIHFTHTRRFGKLFEKVSEEGSFVPETLTSLIAFSTGLGYTLEPMLESYDIKSMYIYEPNPDFFYWSLFTVPWHELLPKQREKGMHWYINIGDDGTYLHEDMFSQFHSEGGYLTASAFFFIPSYYPAIQPHINQLRRDFQSYLMLCEYFDHVRFFLRQSQVNLERGAPLLKAGVKLGDDLKDTPVMIVGNGPSIDQTIQSLKERRDEFILISCGTALKPLYEAGITPDFHTEVEQNRATYHWVTQVPDRDWLKRVTLISLTPFHPDTAALFRQQWCVFKKGEAGTSAFLKLSEPKGMYSAIDYCYPTVTNMALSLSIRLGFENIYMTGVDLGFKDINHHHSKNSAYYTESKEKSWHDYRKAAGEGIPVRGNFEPQVLTKYEFMLSSRIMSQLLRTQPEVSLVNTSDGAYIEGSTPQQLSEIPAMETLDREAILAKMEAELFTREGVELMLSVLRERINPELTAREAEVMIELASRPVHTRDEGLQAIEDEKQYLLSLFRENRSLWFFLIYSSAHFVSAALVRLLYSAEDEAKALAYFEEGRVIWREYIAAARDAWCQDHEAFDQTVVKSLQAASENEAKTPPKAS